MHLLILMPILILILVRFLNRLQSRVVTTFIVTILVATNLWVDIRYYNTLLQVPGKGFYSSKAYSLAGGLEQLGISKVIACDWGLARHVYYFSQGRIRVKEVFGYSRSVPPSF